MGRNETVELLEQRAVQSNHGSRSERLTSCRFQNRRSLAFHRSTLPPSVFQIPKVCDGRQGVWNDALRSRRRLLFKPGSGARKSVLLLNSRRLYAVGTSRHFRVPTRVAYLHVLASFSPWWSSASAVCWRDESRRRKALFRSRHNACELDFQNLT